MTVQQFGALLLLICGTGILALFGWFANGLIGMVVALLIEGIALGILLIQFGDLT